MSESLLALGIDMGGTNARYAIVDPTGRIVASESRPLPHSIEDRAHLPAVIAERFSDQISSVGLAVAGTVTEGVLTWSANLGLSNVDFASDIHQASGLPAVVLNDARAAGYAEAVAGAGQGAATVLSITVGTGIGGAFIIDDELLSGTGDAGEIGHMVIDPAGPPCRCGRSGCWERYVGGRALASAAADLYSGSSDPIARLIVEAEQGDAQAQQRISHASELFQLGVDNLQAMFAPHAVILGGGIMARDGLVARSYLAASRRTRWGTRGDVRVSTLGDVAGQIGAGLAALKAIK